MSVPAAEQTPINIQDCIQNDNGATLSLNYCDVSEADQLMTIYNQIRDVLTQEQRDKITTFDISGNRITTPEAIDVVLDNILPALPNLTSFDFHDNKLLTNGTSALFAAFRKQKLNQSLTHLNLSENVIKDDGMQMLAMTKFPPLRELHLVTNLITDVGAKSFATHLTAYPNVLTTLTLDNNFLCDSGVDILMTALQVSGGKLKELSIGDVKVTPVGCKSIAKYLRSSGAQSLVSLNLSVNAIGNEGALILLRDGVSQCPSLRLFDIACNDIGDEGVRIALVADLARIQYLLVLDLVSNGITDDGGKDLIAALKVAPVLSLRELRMDGNPVTNEVGVELVEWAMNNTGMIVAPTGVSKSSSFLCTPKALGLGIAIATAVAATVSLLLRKGKK